MAGWRFADGFLGLAMAYGKDDNMVDFCKDADRYCLLQEESVHGVHMGH